MTLNDYSDPAVRRGKLWRDFNWFALRSKTRREHYAAANVNALGIETLLPQIRAERLVRGAVRICVKPLFSGYFFARFCPENSIELVRHSRGVLQVVSAGQIPIPVPSDVVREIQDRVNEDGLIKIYPRSLAPGTQVIIKDGPFEGIMGRVERELDDRRRVAIFLETLLQARVQIERRWIDAVAA